MELSLKQRILVVLWPAFLMAGVMETLVFAVVDPADLRWFGGAQIGWSALAIYTVSFLIFWAVFSVAGALTTLLALPSPGPAAPRGDDGDTPDPKA
jgi:hypothetical protein